MKILNFFLSFLYFCLSFGTIYSVETFIFKRKIRTMLILIFNVLSNVLCLCYVFFIKKREYEMDNLTGLRNRNQLYTKLYSLIRKKKDFKLIFIDLNNFKKINDCFGHKEGDNILALFGFNVKKIPNTICYRFGGDEFILISFEENLECFMKFVNSKKFDFSYGIASFSSRCYGVKDVKKVANDLIELADKRMYMDKNKR